MNGVVRRFRKDPSKYSKEDLVEIIEAGQFELEKIRNATKLALKADFDLMTNKVNVDVIQFIDEYLDSYKDILHALSIRATLVNLDNIKLKRSFRPIEMTILVDNLLVNAGKADATRVRVEVDERKRKDLKLPSWIMAKASPANTNLTISSREE